MRSLVTPPVTKGLAGALILVGAGAGAQPGPFRVADINPSVQLDRPSRSRGVQLVELGGLAYFQGNDGIHGEELWRSDGTAAGTYLVRDICPGVCSSRPQYLSVAGRWLHFQADDGVHGAEPWVSDGTTGGTALVRDIRPGLRGSAPRLHFALGAQVLFIADDGIHGFEPWVSDGTEGGTSLLRDIWPGSLGSGSERPPLGTVAGAALFAADDGVSGFEPWRTDGTPAGTERVGDFNPGSAGSLETYRRGLGPTAISGSGGELYFSANDGASGYELWKSDGTAAGTFRVADIEPGPGGSWPEEFARRGSEVFFAAFREDIGLELWKSDGTAPGTSPVGDLLPGSESSWPRLLTEVGDRILFFADAFGGSSTLWKTDGSEPGTVAVHTFSAGSLFDAPLAGVGITTLGDQAVFFAPDAATGLEPWVSDGSTEGTRPLGDLNPGEEASFYKDGLLYPFLYDRWLELNGRLYFRAFDAAHGAEIWSTDGTAEGTSRIEDSNAQASAFAHLPDGDAVPLIPDLTPTGDRVFFVADDGIHGRELWASDGTDSGTALVADINSGALTSHPERLATVFGRLVFTAYELAHEDFRLWASDGTAAGTAPVVDAEHGGQVAGPVWQWTSAGRTLYGRRSDLLRTDGLTAESVAPGLGETYELEAAGDALFFVTRGSPAGARLWRLGSDDEGLLLGEGWQQAEEEAPSDLTAAGSWLFFGAGDPIHGRELWMSDGLPGGVRMVKDIQPGALGSLAGESPPLPRPFAALGAQLLFVADDGASGHEPWVSDGTKEGTMPLGDLMPGPAPSDPTEITAVGGLAYFVASDPLHGRELWRTDGTPGGTTLVADLLPGAESSLPQELRLADGRLYFSAWTPALGREAWTLDAGGRPQLVADLAAGPGSSSPSGFSWARGHIFFVASDNLTGFELWALPTESLFADGFESGELSAWSAVVEP